MFKIYLKGYPLLPSIIRLPFLSVLYRYSDLFRRFFLDTGSVNEIKSHFKILNEKNRTATITEKAQDKIKPVIRKTRRNKRLQNFLISISLLHFIHEDKL